MNRFVLWMVLAACLPGLARSHGWEREEELPGPIAADLVRVIDGDTVEVRAKIWLDQTVQTHVRLLGVDAPELHSDCAAERSRAWAARDFVAHMLGAGPLTLTGLRYDKYGGRILAHVAGPHGDLAQALIAHGLARPYDGGARTAWCA